MTPERRLEIIADTWNLIRDPNRWGQGTMEQHPLIDRFLMRPPRLCLVGALRTAAAGSPRNYNAECAEIEPWLGELIPPAERRSAYGDVHSLMAWNDHSGRTHTDVMSLLTTAWFETRLEMVAAPAEVPEAERV